MTAGDALLFSFDRFPLLHHALAVAHGALAEDVRMSPNQLSGDFLEHLADIEAAGLLRDFRVHHREQNQVAQFLAQIRVIPRTHGARDFVGFFNQWRQKRFVRLLRVPRTAAGCPEFCDDLTKLLERRHSSTLLRMTIRSATTTDASETRRPPRLFSCRRKS